MQSSEKMVSVVIPVYNGANYMRAAIDSALQQTYHNIEVIVVNDGSRDEGKTEEIALSYGNKIRYFKKKNGGVSTALNLGIREMKGEYFAWLSHDDRYLRNKIQRQIEMLEKSGSPQTILASGFQLIDENGQYMYRTDPIGTHQYSMEELSRPLFALLHGCLHGCSLLIHKSHFKRVGMFDDRLKVIQDYELFFRLLRGQPLCYMQGMFLQVRSHNDQGIQNLTEEQSQETTDIWYKILASLTKEDILLSASSVYAFWHSFGTCGVYPMHKADKVTELINREQQKALREMYKENQDLIMYREFSYLLFELSENYELRFIRQYQELSATVTLATGKSRMHLRTRLKRLLAKPYHLAYRIGRKITEKIGIKEALKNTTLYKKMFKRGEMGK